MSHGMTEKGFQMLPDLLAEKNTGYVSKLYSILKTRSELTDDLSSQAIG